LQAEAHLASPHLVVAISVTIACTPQVFVVTMTLLQAALPHSSMLAALVAELLGMPRQAEAHLASPHLVVAISAMIARSPQVSVVTKTLAL
jgi:hypothetical protein